MLTKNTPCTAPIGSCTVAHTMRWCLAYRKKPTTQPGLIGPLALWVCVSYCFSMWYRLFEFNRQFICFILAHHQFRISIMCRSIYSRCSVHTLKRCMHQLAKFKWNVHIWTLNYFNNALCVTAIITRRSAAHRLVMMMIQACLKECDELSCLRVARLNRSQKWPRFLRRKQTQN